jgi:hypothetical protein
VFICVSDGFEEIRRMIREARHQLQRSTSTASA